MAVNTDIIVTKAINDALENRDNLNPDNEIYSNIYNIVNQIVKRHKNELETRKDEFATKMAMKLEKLNVR